MPIGRHQSQETKGKYKTKHKTEALVVFVGWKLTHEDSTQEAEAYMGDSIATDAMAKAKAQEKKGIQGMVEGWRMKQKHVDAEAEVDR